MTTALQTELTKHEADVEAGAGDFIKVGKALAVINDKQLYGPNGAGFKTFDSYWDARWAERFEFGSRQARYLIKSMEVIEPLVQSNPNVPLPRTERQARALAPLVLGRGRARKDPNPDAAVKLLEKLNRDGGVTAEKIAAGVAKLLPKSQKRGKKAKMRSIKPQQKNLLVHWNNLLIAVQNAVVDAKILSDERRRELKSGVVKKIVKVLTTFLEAT